MTRSDLEALRRKRDEAAAKANSLADQYDRWPHVEILRARDAAMRLVDAYDRARRGQHLTGNYRETLLR